MTFGQTEFSEFLDFLVTSRISRRTPESRAGPLWWPYAGNQGRTPGSLRRLCRVQGPGSGRAKRVAGPCLCITSLARCPDLPFSCDDSTSSFPDEKQYPRPSDSSRYIVIVPGDRLLSPQGLIDTGSETGVRTSRLRLYDIRGPGQRWPAGWRVMAVAWTGDVHIRAL